MEVISPFWVFKMEIFMKRILYIFLLIPTLSWTMQDEKPFRQELAQAAKEQTAFRRFVATVHAFGRANISCKLLKMGAPDEKTWRKEDLIPRIEENIKLFLASDNIVTDGISPEFQETIHRV